MKKTHLRSLVLAAAALSAVAVLLVLPDRVAVEVAKVTRGPLVVTVDASARTRVRERRVLAAPASGTLERIERRPGDAVSAGDVVARLGAPAAAPLDGRTRADLEARLLSAQAAAEEAAAGVARAEVAQAHAERELGRLRPLAQAGAASQQALDGAEFEREARRAELRLAEAARETAQRNVAVVRAQLARLDEGGRRPADGGEVLVRSPVAGQVLRLLCETEGPVQAGTPLLEIGDPATLEAVVDVLTSDAVAVAPGAEVLFERWGGADPLRGRVRRVEPAGFTKLSALGVEEQRVNVIVDPEGGAEAWAGKVGDGYRLEARIVVFRSEAVKAPLAALARGVEGWSAFVVSDGRARARKVEVGRRAAGEAEVVSGLAPGEVAVLYPGTTVRDGVRVKAE